MASKIFGGGNSEAELNSEARKRGPENQSMHPARKLEIFCAFRSFRSINPVRPVNLRKPPFFSGASPLNTPNTGRPRYSGGVLQKYYHYEIHDTCPWRTYVPGHFGDRPQSPRSRVSDRAYK